MIALDRGARSRLAIAGAAVVALAAGLVALSPAPVGVFWDDAVYVITAKAIATGEGYRYIHLPGAPAATHFPPLWPALLSVVWRIDPSFPENVRWMKLLNPVLLAAAAAGATVLARRVTRAPLWLVAIAVGASCAVAQLLLVSATLMSEPLGLAMCVAAIIASTSVVMRGRLSDGVIAGLLVGLAVLARSAAIALLAGLAVGLLWRRSRRASAVAVVTALVAVAPWFLWSIARAGELPAVLADAYGPYAGWMLRAYASDPALGFEVVRHNIATMFGELGVVLFSGTPRAVRPPLLALLLTAVGAGLTLAGRRAAPLSVSLCAYVALVAVWPYPPGRFLWAVFPLLMVAGVTALTAIWKRARRGARTRWVGAGVVALGVVAVTCVIRNDVAGFTRGWHRLAIEHQADAVVAAVGWIARYTAPTDTIATDVHLPAHLYAGRTAIPLTVLTVKEYLRPKTNDEMHGEFRAIDQTFRPRWWIVSRGALEGSALVTWATDSAGAPRLVAQLPNGGVAARSFRK